MEWIDIETHNDHTIMSFMNRQKPSLDCYDMIIQSLEEATERSTTVTSARRRSSTILRNGYLKIGCQLLQKEEERRNDLNIVWIQTLPINSCTFAQFKDIQEIMLLILHCKTMYYYRNDLPNTSTTSGTRLNFWMTNGLIQGRTSLNRGRQAVFFTTVNPMDDGYGMGETARNLTKPRIMPNKNTLKRLQNTIHGCNVKLAQEKDLQFTVTCSRSLQHIVCSLHWESDMHENLGWALPEGALNSESATSRARIELPIWSTRSTKPRSKIVFGNIKRFEKIRGHL